MSTKNLPSQPTSFVGREKELAEIASLLVDPNCRLLTLVGSGGIGKTRLALKVATDQKPHFVDGVVFVPLAPVVSHDLLTSAIAGALEISFFGSEELRIQLMSYLCEKQILLVMDNFEHLLDGVGLVSELLQAAPGLKILATSRERLNIQEEWAFALDGLSYPSEASTNSPENYSAVQLFIQRARQVQAHFAFDQNAQAVESISRKLEGMPLGLELAASWLRVMSCKQIEAQIASKLDFLTTPLRNIPDRHRSLRAVFDQSWRLLSGDEQAVLMKLSVFRGGFDLEAAEAIAGASLLLLSLLADKSLIRVNASGRYDLHELLRQYAADKLLDAGIANDIIQKHIDYFFKLAEQMEAHLFGREQILWFDRLEVEMDNLRAALARSTESETGLRLAAALGWFFSERTYWSEGLSWVGQSLEANPDAPASVRAKALHHVGSLAGHIDDVTSVRASCEQAIAIARTTHDDWNMAWALSHLGLYTFFNLDQSIARLEESVGLFRKLNDPMGLAHNLIRLSNKVIEHKDIPYAITLIDEAAALIDEVGDTIMAGWIAIARGRIARQHHDFKQSIIHFEISISYFRQAQMPEGVHQSLISLAYAELAIGNLDGSLNYFKEAVFLNRVILRNDVHSPVILAGLAGVAKAHGQFERAVHLLAAAEDEYLVEFEWLQLVTNDPQFTPYLSDIAEVRTQMGEEAFAKAWAIGKAMTRQQAMDYGLDGRTSPTETLSTPNPADQPLTDRELEILHLIADGLNSREIAEHLFLSVGTIRWYLKQIYSKLNVHGRSEAIARAKELKLLR